MPLLAPNRYASIPGLVDQGAKCAMRHVLTAFGSGWQGLDEGYSIKFEKSGLKEWMGILKKGEEEAGFMTYAMGPGGVANVASTQLFSGFKGQGLGKSMYTEAMRHAKSQGAIKFRSDVKIDSVTRAQAVSEDAAHVWESAERAGIAEKIQGERGWVSNLFNLEKNIMKSGEGMAIGKAGTAEVPSVLRATSRIIRSAL